MKVHQVLLLFCVSRHRVLKLRHCLSDKPDTLITSTIRYYLQIDVYDPYEIASNCASDAVA